MEILYLCFAYIKAAVFNVLTFHVFIYHHVSVPVVRAEVRQDMNKLYWHHVAKQMEQEMFSHRRLLLPCR